MAKLTKVVKVDESLRDLIQRLWLEYYQKERVVKGLMDDHMYDDDPTQFLDSAIFKAYEDKTAKALLAYETATEEMKDKYLPDDFKKTDNYQWSLDYETCNLTFTKA